MIAFIVLSHANHFLLHQKLDLKQKKHEDSILAILRNEE